MGTTKIERLGDVREAIFLGVTILRADAASQQCRGQVMADCRRASPFRRGRQSHRKKGPNNAAE
jgi:hypothetical protein